MMMFAKTTSAFIALLAISGGSKTAALEDKNLRGSERNVEQFACAIAGAPGQDACDAAEDTDGTSCVWCSMSTIGFCVSEAQAEAIEDKFPIVTCDSDSKSDDETPPADDDEATADDDEAATDDNASPDEYWKCLKSSKDEKTCSGAGCTWCGTAAGYGICLASDAAEQADKSDWFKCKSDVSEEILDPFDTSCIIASLSGDEGACESTTDQDGQACAWCAVAGYDFCLTAEQAELAEQTGAECGKSSSKSIVVENSALDPFDTACLIATLSEDEQACEATTDSDGEPCEWCTVAGAVFCLTSEQATIAGEIGGTCGEKSVENDSASDPFDMSCLVATLSEDEGACEATTGSDGESCQWCTVIGQLFCLTTEQATIAGQVGGSCDDVSVQEASATGPYDMSCIIASLSGDEGACEATVDSNGDSCEWCKIGVREFCVTPDQADIFGQVGAQCSSQSIDEDSLADPFDTSCLIASLSGDESACESTRDQDGQGCQWCSVAGYSLCLSADQAEMATEAGAECGEAVDVDKELMSSPYDTSCLVASLSNDEATCEGTMDQDGETCQWCELSSVGLCLTSEQAELAAEIGADCSSESRVSVADQ